MREYGSSPRARQEGLLEETVGEELLLYDQSSHVAHCLSPVAACVWRHCDGERDVSELAQLAGASESLVADALHELLEKDLLNAEPQLAQRIVPDISRREAISQAARYGAAATTLPLIVSAIAATPAMASSGEVTACEADLNKLCCSCATECVTELNEEQCRKYCNEHGGGFKGWARDYTCKP